MNDFLNKVAVTEFTVSKGVNGNTLKQTERNVLKAELMAKIAQLVSEVTGLENYQVSDGYAFMVQNDTEGYIPITLDLKIKSLDYDVLGENEAFIAGVQAKAVAKEKAIAERKRKFEAKQAERAMKAILKG